MILIFPCLLSFICNSLRDEALADPTSTPNPSHLKRKIIQLLLDILTFEYEVSFTLLELSAAPRLGVGFVTFVLCLEAVPFGRSDPRCLRRTMQMPRALLVRVHGHSVRSQLAWLAHSHLHPSVLGHLALFSSHM